MPEVAVYFFTAQYSSHAGQGAGIQAQASHLAQCTFTMPISLINSLVGAGEAERACKWVVDLLHE